MEDVHPKQVADLVHRWRTTPLETTGEVMAPRTVRNAYSVLSAMLRYAAIDGVVDQTPCVLTERELGPCSTRIGSGGRAPCSRATRPRS